LTCNGTVAEPPTKQVCSALLATLPSRLLFRRPNSKLVCLVWSAGPGGTHSDVVRDGVVYIHPAAMLGASSCAWPWLSKPPRVSPTTHLTCLR